VAHNSLILTFSTRKMLINVANLWLFLNFIWLFWLFLASDLAIFSYYNLATLHHSHFGVTPIKFQLCFLSAIISLTVNVQIHKPREK
jgi:hypothetical protein